MVTRERASGADRAPTEASTEGGAPSGAPTLIPGLYYELEGVRLKYAGRGHSGLYWFSKEEPELKALPMEPALVRELLDSGLMRPCPPG